MLINSQAPHPSTLLYDGFYFYFCFIKKQKKEDKSDTIKMTRCCLVIQLFLLVLIRSLALSLSHSLSHSLSLSFSLCMNISMLFLLCLFVCLCIIMYVNIYAEPHLHYSITVDEYLQMNVCTYIHCFCCYYYYHHPHH